MYNKVDNAQSTITEKMVAVHIPSNALRSKILSKANGCLLKDRRQALNQILSADGHFVRQLRQCARQKFPAIFFQLDRAGDFQYFSNIARNSFAGLS